MSPSISLAMPWCPWIPERVESMQRLRGALHLDENPVDAVREFTDRAPNDVWSEAVFEWLASTSSDWGMQIQEDALVPPNFWHAARAVFAALPKDADIVGFHVCPPAAEPLAAEGVRMFTTADALVGVCWAMRTETLRQFLEWRRTALHVGWRTPVEQGGLPAITEDTMIGLFAMATNRRIYHPIPALVDHDTSMASVWGNDAHENRRPRVSWASQGSWTMVDLEHASFWRESQIPHIGRFYEATPRLAKRWIKGASVNDYARWRADDGAPVLTGLKYKMLARAYREPANRLFLATPYRGAVHPEYVKSVLQLQRLVGLDVQHEMSLDVRHESQDLVRVRSRMLRIAYHADCTHLLFADGDNAWSPEAVLGMLRTGKDYVQCPYLGRDGNGYRIRASEKDRRAGRTASEDIQPDNTIEIEHTGLGLTLISRECMGRMLDAYGGGDLDYFDLVDGQLYSTTALFQLMIRGGALMSEDTSFATRWRDIGGKVWLYIGAGSPIPHYGETKFQGQIEDLGFSRGKAAAE